LSAEIDEKMDIIIDYLHRIDRRDRIRTIGAFFRGMFGLIPILIMIWSVWYFVEHGDDMLQKITGMAAQQAASITQQGGTEFLEKFKLMFPEGTQ
ncbi:MAG: hypothetical protein KAS32_16025, partial [Candidatus Peribacteraceae bacterium]|nr:hypothetical protein [Candidatus Peribacteraceae bacterium]